MNMDDVLSSCQNFGLTAVNLCSKHQYESAHKKFPEAITLESCFFCANIMLLSNSFRSAMLHTESPNRQNSFLSSRQSIHTIPCILSLHLQLYCFRPLGPCFLPYRFSRQIIAFTLSLFAPIVKQLEHQQWL